MLLSGKAQSWQGVPAPCVPHQPWERGMSKPPGSPLHPRGWSPAGATTSAASPGQGWERFPGLAVRHQAGGQSPKSLPASSPDSCSPHLCFSNTIPAPGSLWELLGRGWQRARGDFSAQHQCFSQPFTCSLGIRAEFHSTGEEPALPCPPTSPHPAWDFHSLQHYK